MLFHHKIKFSRIDPLADGLGDDIQAEKVESEHFELQDPACYPIKSHCLSTRFSPSRTMNIVCSSR
jgi:hypothetical protein